MACWTPVGPDWELVANKSGPTRLGFVLMQKFFELEDRFPRLVGELPRAAVDYVTDVVKVPARDLAKYDLSFRSAKGHRTQISEATGSSPACSNPPGLGNPGAVTVDSRSTGTCAVLKGGGSQGGEGHFTKMPQKVITSRKGNSYRNGSRLNRVTDLLISMSS
ncbi:DUF4158 domain-containing protein [Streptomyces sp. NPDC059627]